MFNEINYEPPRESFNETLISAALPMPQWADLILLKGWRVMESWAGVVGRAGDTDQCWLPGVSPLVSAFEGQRLKSLYRGRESSSSSCPQIHDT